MTWLLAARAFLGSVPKWAWAVLAFVVLTIAFLVWLDREKDKAVEADRAKSNTEVLGAAREADERAHGAAQGTREGIEAANERARKAAEKSDDPLRAGLNELREGDRD